RRQASVIGGFDELASVDAEYVIALGSPDLRRQVSSLADEAGRKAASLWHPLASSGSDVRAGEGLVVAAGARVTTHVRLGRHVHLNVNCSVSHDCVLADFATLSPGSHLSGNVRLGERVLLGTGSVVVPGVSVGAGTV